MIDTTWVEHQARIALDQIAEPRHGSRYKSVLNYRKPRIKTDAERKAQFDQAQRNKITCAICLCVGLTAKGSQVHWMDCPKITEETNYLNHERQND